MLRAFTLALYLSNLIKKIVLMLIHVKKVKIPKTELFSQVKSGNRPKMRKDEKNVILYIHLIDNLILSNKNLFSRANIVKNFFNSKFIFYMDK